MCIRDRLHSDTFTFCREYDDKVILQIGDQLVRLEEREIRNSSGDYERITRGTTQNIKLNNARRRLTRKKID